MRMKRGMGGLKAEGTQETWRFKQREVEEKGAECVTGFDEVRLTSTQEQIEKLREKWRRLRRPPE